MKKIIPLLLFSSVALATTIPLGNQNSLNTAETLIYKKLEKAMVSPFAKGEKLEYKLSYGVLGGGTATIEVRNENKQLNGKNLFHIVATGKSTSFWDNFYKVRDRYETYMEEKTGLPRLFIRNVDEGGYQFSQAYKFFHEKNIVKTQEDKSFEVPDNVQDMVSAFFYARTFDFTKISKGDVITVQSFVDEEVFPLSIRFLGYENVNVKGGKFNCMKFAPIVQQGRIFKTEDDLTVWISNDNNKIPIKAEAKILIGSVTMELTHAAGLASKSQQSLSYNNSN